MPHHDPMPLHQRTRTPSQPFMSLCPYTKHQTMSILTLVVTKNSISFTKKITIWSTNKPRKFQGFSSPHLYNRIVTLNQVHTPSQFTQHYPSSHPRNTCRHIYNLEKINSGSHWFKNSHWIWTLETLYKEMKKNHNSKKEVGWKKNGKGQFTENLKKAIVKN